jgi:hypothetical protein
MPTPRDGEGMPLVKHKKSRDQRSRLFVSSGCNYFLALSSAAWAAAKRAIGTRKGLQET